MEFQTADSFVRGGFVFETSDPIHSFEVMPWGQEA
jgi:hypothetical protein